MHSLHLNIRTPEKEIFNDQVQFVSLKNEHGAIKILPKHASMTATIDFTPLRFVDIKNVEEDFLIRRGIISVSNKSNRVDILVFECAKKSELSPTTAKKYLEFIEEKLAKKADLSQFQIKFLQEEKFVIEKQVKHLKSQQ